MEFIIQFTIVVSCLLFGAQKGGIGLGLAGGCGMLVLVGAFNLQPGQPPVDVILVIISVVAASATLQASGGLNVLLQLAEKLLRQHPKYISLLAPLVTCLLTMLCGTGHMVYTLLPIIYDVAIKNNIRPERPLAASSVGSQMGIIASPVSVATVSLSAMLASSGGVSVDFITLLSITIPATLCGILAIALFSCFRGKNLSDDDVFLAFIDKKVNQDYVYGTAATLLSVKLPRSSRLAMGIFITFILVIALLGVFPDLRSNAEGTPLSMAMIIQMCMLCGGAFILLFTDTTPSDIAKSDVFRSGMVAIVAVYGVAWMADTFFSHHLTKIEDALAGVVSDHHPWAYVFVLLLLSQFVNSQAAALAALVPIALAVGVPPSLIAATAPACYGYYILPTYPSDLAAVELDRTGTTRIGRWVINHSFLPVGLTGVGVSCSVGWLLAHLYDLM
ncbi:anaerobic C4-dicarboxylate transporter [secondary endosymbiont of Ctenarytaina eucalypti]|uniref:C4-dicarboxylate transporter n=1 Tax=secondary endosymbiont of Ctenarytaina eucalypti TaxID=1199245 RepID=J3TF23_9ENTR|nr:anaerobic C4-dicarboxylate transporter [secondary endosymbiont of Ctenarytaina eucalypti]AFP84617.1 anaerobic c4-dicarboxylate membrane transporter family protein [secondary endosymbiont of Ctenarytaina eucalypti]